MLEHIGRRAGKFVSDNYPTILTSVGVVGTVATAVLTGKAAYEIGVELTLEETDRQTIMTPREKLEHVMEDRRWVSFVPAISVGLTTIAAIIAANRAGTRRAAAIAAAYAISERTFAEYQDRIISRIGQRKETTVRDELAQEQVSSTPVREVIITGRGTSLCFDAFTGRYFESSIEEIRRAENDINFKILNDLYASLTEYYELVGLTRTSHSDELGWRSGQKFVVDISTTLSDDERPCLHISFRTSPVRDYYRLG